MPTLERCPDCQPSATETSVRRYDIYMHSDDVQFLRECADGDYVKYSAIAALEKQRDELKLFHAESQRQSQLGWAKVKEQEYAIAELRAELAECRGIPDTDYGMLVAEYIAMQARSNDELRTQLAAAQAEVEKMREVLGRALPIVEMMWARNPNVTGAVGRCYADIRTILSPATGDAK